MPSTVRESGFRDKQEVQGAPRVRVDTDLYMKSAAEGLDAAEAEYSQAQRRKQAVPSSQSLLR